MSSFQKNKQKLREQGKTFWYYQNLKGFSPTENIFGLINKIPFKDEEERSKFVEFHDELNSKITKVL